MAVAFLKEKSLGRIVSGHPWVYATDLFKIEKPPEDGGEILVRSPEGGFVGFGFYNSQSRIPIRIFTRTKEVMDKAFFHDRILRARLFRQRFHGEKLPEVCRLFWSEADFLPGLIVDRYGETIVMQTLTLAMDQRKEMLVEILRSIYNPAVILERNDVASRQFEGMLPKKGFLFGEVSGKQIVTMGNARMEIDLLQGQKTGSYLDQIGSHQWVGGLAKEKKVLDCFSYHGGFALHAALGGATEIVGLDISEDAIVACRRNADLNGVNQIQWKAVNVFDELTALKKKGEKFDLIVLDPPSFTKTRAKLQDALRGYKEIHLKALNLLKPGGLLATFCCSHHVDAEMFRAVALDAAFDSRIMLRLHRSFGQSWDHPIIPSIPETEYLKGFLFEVI